MLFRAICLTICSFFVVKTAWALQVYGALQQGGLIYVSDDKLQKIKVNGKVYHADEEGQLLIAFGRDADVVQSLKVFYNDGSMETRVLNLSETQWDIQHVNGLAPSKVTPQQLDMAEISKERDAFLDALAVSTDAKSWKSSMQKPLDGRISGRFGNQRIMNGIKKNPHQGMDIAAPEGTEVVAMTDGVVAMSDGPFFYSGNVVVLEHGQNLSTIYAHLNTLAVQKGDQVTKGQVIGTVGHTGRATGPHLHLGASLNGVRFDAQHLIDLDKTQCIDL